MAGSNLSNAALRNRDNGTDSRLPTGELAEAIELLQQARGILECLEAFAEPGMEVASSGLNVDEHVKRMANASSGAARRVTQAQAFLIEAHVIESQEVLHG